MALFVVLVIIGGLIYKFRVWIKVVPKGLFNDSRRVIGIKGLISLFFSELANRVLAEKEVLNDSRTRRATHLMVFWGFLGLAFATVWDDIFFHQGPLPTPFSLGNPGNIVGNIGGLLVLVGMTVMVLRYALVSKFSKAAKGDISFLVVLYFAAVSGFVTEFARFSGGGIAISAYTIHLALVFALLITAPFTHFFHAILTPFLRYVEEIQKILIKKGVIRYPYYRKAAMSNLAVNIKENEAAPTYPNWIDEIRKKENEN